MRRSRARLRSNEMAARWASPSAWPMQLRSIAASAEASTRRPSERQVVRELRGFVEERAVLGATRGGERGARAKAAQDDAAGVVMLGSGAASADRAPPLDDASMRAGCVACVEIDRCSREELLPGW